MCQDQELIKEIVKGCRQRRRESQKKLYRMFYAYGMSITLRYASSRGEASEMLNDAFMKVFNNINSYDSDRPIKPWLRRIIINTAINHYHKHENDREQVELEAVQSEVRRKQEILSRISYDEIVDMVQQLSSAYRTVFNLYVIEGFKHREIAEMLGIAVGTSKSNLAKAKRNLQSLVEENFC